MSKESYGRQVDRRLNVPLRNPCRTVSYFRLHFRPISKAHSPSRVRVCSSPGPETSLGDCRVGHEATGEIKSQLSQKKFSRLKSRISCPGGVILRRHTETRIASRSRPNQYPHKTRTIPTGHSIDVRGPTVTLLRATSSANSNTHPPATEARRPATRYLRTSMR